MKFEAEFIYTDNAGNTIHTLLAELGTTTALGKEENIRDIRVECGGRSCKLDHKDESPIRPQDTVGMTFETRDRKVESLQDIQSISLKLGTVERWVKQ